MIGYAQINRLRRQAGELSGVFDAVTAVANIAAQGFNAYTQYEQLSQQEDALKLKKNQLAAEAAALRDAKAMAEQEAQQALLEDRQAASVGIAAAAANSSEIPTWVWVAGAVAVTSTAIYLIKRKRK